MSLIAVVIFSLICNAFLTNAQTDHPISWRIQQYPPMTISVGDSITFNYAAGFHTVVDMDDIGCSFTDGGVKRTTPPSKVVFDTEGTFFLGCDIGNHCRAGMALQVNVVQAAMEAVETPPTSAPAAVGPTPKRKLSFKDDRKCDRETVEKYTIRTFEVNKANKCKKRCRRNMICEGAQYEVETKVCTFLSVVPSFVPRSPGFLCGRIRFK